MYKFDSYKEIIEETFYENYKRYVSVRLYIALGKKGIFIGEGVLRNYMARWVLKTITRTAKHVGNKKMKVYVPDLVNRDYHGKNNKIKATDASYIPADEIQNFIYLSSNIEHKTKYVHWTISKVNNMKVVMDTQIQIKEGDYIT